MLVDACYYKLVPMISITVLFVWVSLSPGGCGARPGRMFGFQWIRYKVGEDTSGVLSIKQIPCSRFFFYLGLDHVDVMRCRAKALLLNAKY